MTTRTKPQGQRTKKHTSQHNNNNRIAQHHYRIFAPSGGREKSGRGGCVAALRPLRVAHTQRPSFTPPTPNHLSISFSILFISWRVVRGGSAFVCCVLRFLKAGCIHKSHTRTHTHTKKNTRRPRLKKKAAVPFTRPCCLSLATPASPLAPHEYNNRLLLLLSSVCCT